jgi:hypothetical protein
MNMPIISASRHSGSVYLYHPRTTGPSGNYVYRSIDELKAWFSTNKFTLPEYANVVVEIVPVFSAETVVADAYQENINAASDYYLELVSKVEAALEPIFKEAKTIYTCGLIKIDLSK